MDLPIIIIFAVIFILGVWIAYKLGTYKKHLEWQKNLVKIRADVAERQRAGIKGKITEAFSPFLPNFPYKSSECKFLGDPIDFVAFEGLDERDVKGIHFVEVKEGSSRLSKHQKQIKGIVDELDSKKVTFEEFRFDSDSSI